MKSAVEEHIGLAERLERLADVLDPDVPVTRENLREAAALLRADVETISGLRGLNRIDAEELDRLRAEREGNVLYLWKNFVNGDPQYWAFESPYPIYENGDPMTLGSPAGYAVVKASSDGSRGCTHEQVVEGIKRANDKTVQVPKPRIMKSVALSIGNRLRQFYGNRFALVEPVQHTDNERQVILAAIDLLLAAAEEESRG